MDTNEMTCSDFLKEMAKAGFEGNFRAESEGRKFIGKIEDGKVMAKEEKKLSDYAKAVK
jgi:hypothetical protein